MSRDNCVKLCICTASTKIMNFLSTYSAKRSLALQVLKFPSFSENNIEVWHTKNNKIKTQQSTFLTFAPLRPAIFSVFSFSLVYRNSKVFLVKKVEPNEIQNSFRFITEIYLLPLGASLPHSFNWFNDEVCGLPLWVRGEEGGEKLISCMIFLKIYVLIHFISLFLACYWLCRDFMS